MPEQRVIFGQRGGKSFQAGYEAGYKQCKKDIANEPPSTEEMKWLRKLRMAILGGEVAFRFEHVNPINEPVLKSVLQIHFIEYCEAETSKYIQSLHDQIAYLRERRQQCWIPCNKGNPTEEGYYFVTIEINNVFQRGRYETKMEYTPHLGWIGVSSDMKVIAWRDCAPYNGDVDQEGTNAN